MPTNRPRLWRAHVRAIYLTRLARIMNETHLDLPPVRAIDFLSNNPALALIITLAEQGSEDAIRKWAHALGFGPSSIITTTADEIYAVNDAHGVAVVAPK